MPLKRIPSELYSCGVFNVKPNLTVHPEVVNHPTNAENYLLPAVFTLEKGNPVTVTYDGPAFIYVIEGELQYEDTSKPGYILMSAGDVVHIDQGTVALWNSPSKGKAVGVIYVPSSVKGPEDLIA